MRKREKKEQKEPREKTVKVIPLGGLGAIGKNITLIEYRGEIIVVDCGISFPNEETPGVDFIIPDFTYLRENRKKVRAIIITHGHEDHIGGIPYLLREINVPIYATKLTLGLIQSRLQEHPLGEDVTFVEVKPRDLQTIGRFTVEFIRVNHSIIDGVALAIMTEVGTIIHTGDFKIDFSPVDGEVTDLYRFADHGERGVLLLLSDSTNAEKSGFTKSEASIVDRFISIFSNSRGRIIVATFASNIHRIQQIMDVAQRFNRKVVISGMSMQKNIEISRSLGYLSVKDDLIIDIDRARSIPDRKLVVIGTGTQGEPMSALSRMASGTHRHFKAKKGDTVIITASIIPGNERMITNVVNTIMSLGADVYYDQTEDIHVSGHGSSKELKLMLSITKPRFFMPVHGEFKHLKAHAKLAESLGIRQSNIILAENGDILEVSQGFFRKAGHMDLSRIYVHGAETGDTASSVITDRQIMATNGAIVITVLISEGMLIAEPEVISRGVVSDENSDVVVKIRRDVAGRVRKMLKKNHKPREIEDNLRNGLKNLLFRLTKRNSLIVVQVLEI
jgi:ribonuclease J